MAQAVLARPTPAASPAPRPAARVASQGPHVGQALSATDIQSMLSHAGGGCPLGPCKGCPHHEVTTGACLA